MPINWVNGGTPAINAANLNNLAVISDVATAGTPTGDALRAAFVPKADPAFTGTVGLPGGASGNPRLPVNGAVTIDGATAKNYPGGGDKVGYAFSAVIKGGFTGDTGSNPSFAWGANDFVMTGNAAGGVAGLTDLIARETEVHLYTPGASLSNMKGLQVDANIESTATGSTVGSMFGLYVSPLSNASTGTTVNNAFGVYIEAPTASATNTYGLYVNGASRFVGSATFIGSISANSVTVADPSGTFKSLANTPNGQGAAAGVYVGNGQGAAVELSDGTTNVRLDNGGGTFRVLKAGVQSNFEVDLSGNTKLRGGPGFYNTAPVASRATVTGSRAANAALASLITALAATGLIADGTTA